jgi:hypothetical protein
MFRQVLWTFFTLMERHEPFWRKVKGSEPVDTFGFEGYVEPDPVKVNFEGMVEHFKTGYQQFSSLWKEIFDAECFDAIRAASEAEPSQFYFSTAAWCQVLYELAATFRAWKVNRYKLVDLITPLYYARVASFVRQTQEMSSQEAEALVEEQAAKFEEQKDYLLDVWDQKGQGVS